MEATAGRHRGSSTRHVWVVVAASVVAIVVGGAALRALAPRSATTGVRLSPSLTAPAATTGDAIGTWLAAHRDEVFPEVTGPYAGSCSTGQVGTLCSALTEDLDRAQIHIIGPYATDNGADLLLVRTDAGWEVARWSPWPALGTPSFGAPWSPQTAIAAWWAARADAMGLHGAVHVSTCATAAEVVDTGTSQPVLCSTLIADDGQVRTYESGRFGAPPAVDLVLARQDDDTWVVRDELELEPTR